MQKFKPHQYKDAYNDDKSFWSKHRIMMCHFTRFKSCKILFVLYFILYQTQLVVCLLFFLTNDIPQLVEHKFHNKWYWGFVHFILIVFTH